MTVNGMMLLSKVFLGMMIFFLIAAVVVFFSLDVRKAWRILTGKRISAQSDKKNTIRTEIKNNRINNLISSDSKIKEETQENNNPEGYDPTTVFTKNDAETTVLGNNEEVATGLTQQYDSKDIVMDIIFIHTEITL